MQHESDITPWWDPDITPNEVCTSAMDAHAKLLEHHAGRHAKFRIDRALYTDRGMVELPDDFFRDGLTVDNVIASAVDTVVARLGTNQAIPNAVTIGRWDLQRKARKLTQYLEGEHERSCVHQTKVRMLRDSGVYGTGFVKVARDFSRPRVLVERVRPDRVLIDPLEEYYGAIRTQYLTTPVDRRRLCQLFPEYALEIKNAKPSEQAKSTGISGHGDFVDMVEAWHLKSGEDAKDGRHIICCDGTLLDDPQEWTRDYLPIIPFCWREDPESFWGIGLTEMLMGAQSDLNRLKFALQRAYELAMPHYLVPEGADYDIERHTNEIGAFFTFKGGIPPVFQTPTPISPMFNEREQSVQRGALESAGISPQAANSQKMAGLNSGKAQLVFHDIESERHGEPAKRLERVGVDIAERMLDVLHDLAEDEDVPDSVLELTVGKKTLESLSYKDVRFGESEPFQIRVFPASALSSRLEGRFRQIEMLMDRQMIKPEQAKRLMDIPDIEALNDREQSGMDLVDKLIEECQAVKEGETLQIPDVLPWGYAKWAISTEIAMAEVWDAPKPVIDALANMLGNVEFNEKEQAKKMAELQAIQNPAPIPPEPPMPPGGAGPPGLPM